jgi:hypothetical protein
LLSLRQDEGYDAVAHLGIDFGLIDVAWQTKAPAVRADIVLAADWFQARRTF